MSDYLENIRRMAERGLKMAQFPPMQSEYIDCFQHILDEYTRAKEQLKTCRNDIEIIDRHFKNGWIHELAEALKDE